MMLPHKLGLPLPLNKAPYGLSLKQETGNGNGNGTKYEDVLFAICTLSAHSEFRVMSQLFMNNDPNPNLILNVPDPDKTARHETTSRLCSSAFVQNEVHDEFCQNMQKPKFEGTYLPSQGFELGFELGF